MSKTDRNQAYDARRRAESPTRALYGTQRWRRRAAHQLLIEPLCRECQARGRVTAASVADHIVPHRGDVEAFWSNALQSLCKPCHDVVKQREERRGHSDTLDADGWPVDPRHPANGGPAQVAALAPARRHVEAPRGGESLEPLAARPAAVVRAQRRENGGEGGCFDEISRSGGDR